MKKKWKLVLASGSPRRKQILEWLGIPFSVEKIDWEENSLFTDPQQVVIDLAEQKGREAAKALPLSDTQNTIIITSDTLVALDQKIFGKPKNREDAKSMLQELSGKGHQVWTGVSFSWKVAGADWKFQSFADLSRVIFTSIDEDLLEFYLDTGESLDKAGSYGIQGSALTFIDRLEGSYTSVMGLPLTRVLKELKTIIHGSDNWRDCFE